MANAMSIIVYPVKDLEKAKQFYNAYLGTEPYADGEWYVGYRVGGQEIGLDPNGKAVVGYIEVDDINESLEALKQAGAEVVAEPKDVAAGLLIAQVEIQGNVMGLRQQPKK